MQSILHYDAAFSVLSDDGNSLQFRVYSTPQATSALSKDGLAFALSGAACSPIQYFLSGRLDSSFAPQEPGALRYHGLMYVHGWEWERSEATLRGKAAALRRDHCGLAPKLGDLNMVVELKRERPSGTVLERLRTKMADKLAEDSGSRAASVDALQKAATLARAVEAEASGVRDDQLSGLKLRLRSSVSERLREEASSTLSSTGATGTDEASEAEHQQSNEWGEDDPNSPAVQSWLASLCVGSEVQAQEAGEASTTTWYDATVVDVDEVSDDGHPLRVRFVNWPDASYDVWASRSTSHVRRRRRDAHAEKPAAAWRTAAAVLQGQQGQGSDEAPTRKRAAEAAPGHRPGADDPNSPAVQRWLASLRVNSEVQVQEAGGESSTWYDARVEEVDATVDDGDVRIRFLNWPCERSR